MTLIVSLDRTISAKATAAAIEDNRKPEITGKKRLTRNEHNINADLSFLA